MWQRRKHNKYEEQKEESRREKMCNNEKRTEKEWSWTSEYTHICVECNISAIDVAPRSVHVLKCVLHMMYICTLCVMCMVRGSFENWSTTISPKRIIKSMLDLDYIFIVISSYSFFFSLLVLLSLLCCWCFSFHSRFASFTALSACARACRTYVII